MPTSRREATKQRIVHIAAELFAKNGYHGTGVAELETAVNLRRGALYYHIGSKEDLLYEISTVFVESMVRYGTELLDSPLSAEERFRRLSRMLLREIAENRAEVTVFFREVHSMSADRAAKVLALRDQFEQIWGAIVDQGVREGLFAKTTPVDVKAILGMHNYTYLWMSSAGDLKPEDIADRFCDIFIHGLAERRPR